MSQLKGTLPVGSTQGLGYQRVSGTEKYNNPYANAQYKYGILDYFLNAFGFRSGYDSWKENMTLQAGEEDARIQQMLDARQYDDPSSQVSRMRAAGLNPDLEGGQGISPGDSNMPGEDLSVPTPTEGDGAKIAQFASGVQQAIQVTMSVISGFQGFIGKGIQNRLESLTADGKLMDLAHSTLDSFIPEQPFTEYSVLSPDGRPLRRYRGEEVPEDIKHLAGLGVVESDWTADVLSRALGAPHKMSKKERERYNEFVRQYVSSADFKTKANLKFGLYSQSKSFSTEQDVMAHAYEQVVGAYGREISAAFEKLYKYQPKAAAAAAQAENKAQENRLQYESTFDSVESAKAVNAGNKAAFFQYDQMAALREATDNLVQYFKKKSSSDNTIDKIVGNAGLFGIIGLQSQLAVTAVSNITRPSPTYNYNTTNTTVNNSSY